MLSKKKNNSKKLDIIKKGNVLVLYYANWCQYCVEFKPLWNKLLETLKDEPNLSFIEIESEELQDPKNKSLQNEVEGFPTIKFYKPNTELIHSIKFEGDRKQLQELVKFVKTNLNTHVGGVKLKKLNNFKNKPKSFKKNTKKHKPKSLKKNTKKHKPKSLNKKKRKFNKNNVKNTYNKDVSYFTEKELKEIRKDLKKSHKINKELITNMNKEFKL